MNNEKTKNKQNRRKDSKGKVLFTGEYERKDGTYVYIWTNALGKKKYTYSTSLPKLREKEHNIQVYKTNQISDEFTTLNRIVEKWLYLKTGINDSSLKLYTDIYNLHIKNSYIGTKCVSKITQSDILLFLKEKKETHNETKLSNSYLALIGTILNQTFDFAFNNRIILTNPMHGITFDRQYVKKESLTILQCKELLRRISTSSKSWRIYPLVQILLITGLRISELAGLTWDKIDFDNKCFYIDEQLKRNPNKKSPDDDSVVWDSPKTLESIRTLYMNDTVEQMFKLQKQIDEMLPECKKPINERKNFVFRTQRGTNLSVRSLELTLGFLSDQNDYNEKMDVILPHVTPHTLRHTACSQMNASKLDIKVIQKIMGHSSISTTMDVYTHTQEDLIRNEMSSFDIYK